MANLAQRLLRILSEDEIMRRDVGSLKVSVHRIRNYDGKDSYYAKTYVPIKDTQMRSGVETKPQSTAAAALDLLLDLLKNRNRVTGKLSLEPSNDAKTQRGIDAWKQGRK